MDKTINVGLVGAGFMGKAHSNAYRAVPFFFPDLPAKPVMKPICDVDGKLAQQRRADWGWESCETSAKKLVARNDIDLIGCATPNNSHQEVVLAAAAAGKAILCEKPLGSSAEEARKMADAAKKAGVHNVVSHNSPQRGADCRASLNKGPQLPATDPWTLEGQLKQLAGEVIMEGLPSSAQRFLRDWDTEQRCELQRALAKAFDYWRSNGLAMPILEVQGHLLHIRAFLTDSRNPNMTLVLQPSPLIQAKRRRPQEAVLVTFGQDPTSTKGSLMALNDGLRKMNGQIVLPKKPVLRLEWEAEPAALVTKLGRRKTLTLGLRTELTEAEPIVGATESHDAMECLATSMTGITNGLIDLHEEGFDEALVLPTLLVGVARGEITPTDFVAFVLSAEFGYPQTVIAGAFRQSQGRVSQRIGGVRRWLREAFGAQP